MATKEVESNNAPLSRETSLTESHDDGLASSALSEVASEVAVQHALCPYCKHPKRQTLTRQTGTKHPQKAVTCLL